MPAHPPRSRRALRQNLLKAGMWVFVLLFIASIAGVAIVSVAR